MRRKMKFFSKFFDPLRWKILKKTKKKMFFLKAKESFVSSVVPFRDFLEQSIEFQCTWCSTMVPFVDVFVVVVDEKNLFEHLFRVDSLWFQAVYWEVDRLTNNELVKFDDFHLPLNSTKKRYLLKKLVVTKQYEWVKFDTLPLMKTIAAFWIERETTNGWRCLTCIIDDVGLSVERYFLFVSCGFSRYLPE